MAMQPVVVSGATVAAPIRLTSHYTRLLHIWFTPERLASGRFLLFVWFLARLIVFSVWAFITPSTQGDVLYYYGAIQSMFASGPTQIMPEYPTPVLWILSVPYLAGFGTSKGYVVAFVMMMLALDALFSWTLWRTGGPLRGNAVVFWTLFLLLVGPTAYLRFDLITSVLCGWAVLMLLNHRSRIAGALTGIGAAIKLWPALLWPALCHGRPRQKLHATLGFWITGGSLALASLLFSGPQRLLSPLTWQQGRGLQVESIWATIPMLLRAFRIGDYTVTLSRFQAFEIWGPGVDALKTASTVCTVLGLGCAFLAYLAWLVRGNGRLIESVALIQMVILIMIITNKTFSPQYIIWLGGPQAASYAVLSAAGGRTAHQLEDHRRMSAISAWIAVTTLLTLVVYPVSYDSLVRDWSLFDQVLRVPATLLLVARNISVLVLAVHVAEWVWSFLRPSLPVPRPSPERLPQPAVIGDQG